MSIVKMHEAKTQLSRLVKEVQGGGEVIISRGVRPVARLVPYLLKNEAVRKPGYLKGRIRIADDFDAPLPEEILDAFGCNR
jgi:prevent-host-death family protein